jgi:hypothetical protein
MIVRADYTKSVPEVYTQIASLASEVMKNLKILSAVEHMPAVKSKVAFLHGYHNGTNLGRSQSQVVLTFMLEAPKRSGKQ